MGHRGDGFAQNAVDVGVTVKLEAMFGYNVTEQEGIEDEQKGTIYQTLGDELLQKSDGGGIVIFREI